MLDKVKVLKCLVTSTRADALMKTIMQKKEGEGKKKSQFYVKVFKDVAISRNKMH